MHLHQSTPFTRSDYPFQGSTDNTQRDRNNRSLLSRVQKPTNQSNSKPKRLIGSLLVSLFK